MRDLQRKVGKVGGVTARVGGTPGNDFTDTPQLLSECFGWQFPLGLTKEALGNTTACPKPEARGRILHFMDPRFEEDPVLIMWLFDTQRRHDVVTSVSVVMRSGGYRARKFQALVKGENFQDQLHNAVSCPKSKDAKQLWATVAPLIRASGSKVKWGPQERKLALSHLYALSQVNGPQMWYLTMAPSAMDSVHVLRSGLREVSPFGVDPRTANWEGRVKALVKDYKIGHRAQLARRRPVSAAVSYHKLMETFFTVLCGVPLSHKYASAARAFANQRPGVLGMMVAVYAVTEAQARGGLHAHALGWGDISPETIQRFVCSADFRKVMTGFLDSAITSMATPHPETTPAEHQATQEEVDGVYLADSKRRCKNPPGPATRMWAPPNPFCPGTAALLPPEKQMRAITVASAKVSAEKQYHKHCFTCVRMGWIHCRLSMGRVEAACTTARALQPQADNAAKRKLDALAADLSSACNPQRPPASASPSPPRPLPGITPAVEAFAHKYRELPNDDMRARVDEAVLGDCACAADVMGTILAMVEHDRADCGHAQLDATVRRMVHQTLAIDGVGDWLLTALDEVKARKVGLPVPTQEFEPPPAWPKRRFGKAGDKRDADLAWEDFLKEPLPTRDDRAIAVDLKHAVRRLGEAADGELTAAQRHLHRRAPLQTEFMDTAIAEQRSNECMVVTPTVSEAKAAMFYLAKYLAKVSVAVANALSLVYLATEEAALWPSQAADAATDPHGRQSKFILTKVLNKMSGAMEFSLQQMAAACVGIPSFYSTWKFRLCFVQSAMHTQRLLCGGVPCVRFMDADGDTVEFGIGAEREKGARALFFLYEHVEADDADRDHEEIAAVRELRYTRAGTLSDGLEDIPIAEDDCAAVLCDLRRLCEHSATTFVDETQPEPAAAAVEAPVAQPRTEVLPASPPAADEAATDDAELADAAADAAREDDTDMHDLDPFAVGESNATAKFIVRDGNVIPMRQDTDYMHRFCNPLLGECTKDGCGCAPDSTFAWYRGHVASREADLGLRRHDSCDVDYKCERGRSSGGPASELGVCGDRIRKLEDDDGGGGGGLSTGADALRPRQAVEVCQQDGSTRRATIRAFHPREQLSATQLAELQAELDWESAPTLDGYNLDAFTMLVKVVKRSAAQSRESAQPQTGRELKKARRPPAMWFNFARSHPLHATHVMELYTKPQISMLAGKKRPPPPGKRPEKASATRTRRWERKANAFAQYFSTAFLPWPTGIGTRAEVGLRGSAAVDARPPGFALQYDDAAWARFCEELGAMLGLHERKPPAPHVSGTLSLAVPWLTNADLPSDRLACPALWCVDRATHTALATLEDQRPTWMQRWQYGRIAHVAQNLSFRRLVAEMVSSHRARHADILKPSEREGAPRGSRDRAPNDACHMDTAAIVASILAMCRAEDGKAGSSAQKSAAFMGRFLRTRLRLYGGALAAPVAGTVASRTAAGGHRAATALPAKFDDWAPHYRATGYPNGFDQWAERHDATWAAAQINARNDREERAKVSGPPRAATPGAGTDADADADTDTDADDGRVLSAGAPAGAAAPPPPPAPPPLRPSQQKAADAALGADRANNRLLLFTGPPGTGKTHTANHIVRSLPAGSKAVFISHNGTAAVLGRGLTVHYLFSIGRELSEISEAKVATVRMRLGDATVVIIDEISTLPTRFLLYIDRLLRRVFDKMDTSFGGIRVFLCGPSLPASVRTATTAAVRLALRPCPWRPPCTCPPCRAQATSSNSRRPTACPCTSPPRGSPCPCPWTPTCASRPRCSRPSVGSASATRCAPRIRSLPRCGTACATRRRRARSTAT